MIVPMKKVAIVCLKEERDALLLSLQECGELMLIPPEETSSPTESESGRRLRQSEELLKKIRPYREKKGLLAGRPEIELSDFLEKSQEAEKLREELARLLEEQASIAAAVSESEAAAEHLKPWLGLDPPVESLSGPYSAYISGWISPRLTESAATAITDAGGELTLCGEGPEGAAALLLCYREDRPGLLTVAKENGFTEAVLPIARGSVRESYERELAHGQKLAAQAEQASEKIRELSAKADKLEVLCEQYRAESERADAQLEQTAETVCILGWAREDRTDRLEKAVKSVTDVYALELFDPLPDETPPTAAKNGRFITQFETITDMFSRPRYGDMDPNPVMAPWYWIIFGMMMGDVGYGALMIVLLFAFKKLMRPRGEMAKIVNVLFYSGFTTILFGVLFGSYFGETWNPILFGPLDNPIGMLILSMAIGVLHLFTGMILKMISDIRAGSVWDAILDQLTWIFIITGLILLVFEPLRLVGIAMAGVGAVTILLTGGRKKKGLGKVTGGLGALYNITSFLSDILSYARIMALGLATGVIGMVMNLLAGMVAGVPYAGFLFAALVYLVGHGFNLAMSLLSAYVHDSRLQYIEFFGKFYEGGGVAFTPLALRTQYIDVRKKTNHK